MYINRRHVDRPSGLSPVLRYCMHATRTRYARERGGFLISTCATSLCITDYDDNVVTRPGPSGELIHGMEGGGGRRFPAGDTPGKFVRQRISLSVTSLPIFVLVTHFPRASYNRAIYEISFDARKRLQGRGCLSIKSRCSFDILQNGFFFFTR